MGVTTSIKVVDLCHCITISAEMISQTISRSTEN